MCVYLCKVYIWLENIAQIGAREGDGVVKQWKNDCEALWKNRDEMWRLDRKKYKQA